MNYFETGISILKKIESLGYEAYFIGGAVRDLLLNMPLNDIDITTNMPLDELNKYYDIYDNGSKYSSVTIKLDGFKYEITHYRRDISYADHRHPIVEDADTLKEDTERRDFTINAIAYDKNGKIIDYHNGLDDIKNKIVKAIGNPSIRFEEDSLRILRALYFSSKLGFVIDEKTAKAMKEKSILLKELSDERIFEYFKKILYGTYDYGIQYINHYDYFSSIPEYKRLLECVKREYREEDLVFYYYLKYNRFLSITKSAEKRVAKEAKIILDSDFDDYYLYKYRYAYLRLENVFLNLGYNVREINERINKSPLNNNIFAITGDDLKDIFDNKEIGVMLEKATRAVLKNEVENDKNAIIAYLKGNHIERIKAYIDSYDIITILVDKEIDNEAKDFYLVSKNKKIKLEKIDYYMEHNFNKYLVKMLPDEISLHKEYYIKDESGNKGLLRSGAIVRDPRFDEKFAYSGELGAIYSKTKTIFRMWTPVAKEVKITLFKDDYEETVSLKYTKDNVWEYVHKGDIEGYGYIYHIRIFEEFDDVLDPYALSSSANAKFNYVVDKKKFYKMKYKKPEFSGNYTDAIIYEVNIKDFTQDLDGPKKGCYLGMLENNPTKGGPTGIEYIKSLGVTHVQLLPTFDFEGVDDIEKTVKYNWGYNPVQYFVPSGWYSEKPDDPYSRINELLMLIDAFHKEGIRVNMDVVFNHIYETKYLALGKLNPGYDFRVDLGGMKSNASGCGNVLATEKRMIRRLVNDVLVYFTSVFNVSGFRFDLMGLLDIDTLKLAEDNLKKIDDTIMLYGEGWNMLNPLQEDLRPTIRNNKKLPGYAFFNDKFRDSIRGSQWNKTPGYAFNSENSSYDLENLIKGSCQEFYCFQSPTQTVNYVECHDNYTFFDYGVTSLMIEEYQVLDAARVALGIVLVAEGIPFIHAGEEFYRTKQGVENSYKSRGLINKFSYTRRDKYIQGVNMVRDLISIRKEYPVFRLNTPKKISNQIHTLMGLSTEHRTSFLFSDDKYELFVIIKNDYRDETLELGDVTLIFDGYSRCDLKVNKYSFKNPGVYILRKDK